MNNGLEAAFFAVVALLTVLSLWRELPAQYVVTIAAVMYAIAAIAHWVLRIPLWWLPLIVLNSRGLSRLILYRWRDREYYGWWVMALTCGFSTALSPHWRTPVLALLMQLACVPWLIKRRATANAPGYLPAVNWIMIAGLFWLF